MPLQLKKSIAGQRFILGWHSLVISQIHPLRHKHNRLIDEGEKAKFAVRDAEREREKLQAQSVQASVAVMVAQSVGFPMIVQFANLRTEIYLKVAEVHKLFLPIVKQICAD